MIAQLLKEVYFNVFNTSVNKETSEKFEHDGYDICIHFDYVLGFTGNLCVLLCRQLYKYELTIFLLFMTCSEPLYCYSCYLLLVLAI